MGAQMPKFMVCFSVMCFLLPYLSLLIYKIGIIIISPLEFFEDMCKALRKQNMLRLRRVSSILCVRFNYCSPLF